MITQYIYTNLIQNMNKNYSSDSQTGGLGPNGNLGTAGLFKLILYYYSN